VQLWDLSVVKETARKEAETQLAVAEEKDEREKEGAAS
jgi:hypothetical protein